MGTPPQPDKLERAEAWWAFILRVGAAIFGAWLLYGQSQVPNPPGAQIWIIVAGMACMGPAVAAPAAAMIEALRGGGKGGDPA